VFVFSSKLSCGTSLVGSSSETGMSCFSKCKSSIAVLSSFCCVEASSSLFRKTFSEDLVSTSSSSVRLTDFSSMIFASADFADLFLDFFFLLLFGVAC